MVKYWETFVNALKFGFNPKRWLPLFILDAVLLSIVALFLVYGFGIFLSVLTSTGSAPILTSLITLTVPLIVIVTIDTLLKIWIDGAIIHQANKEKEFEKSWNIALNRYPRLFLVVFVIVILSLLVSMVPFVGFIFIIIISLILFFPLQAVMVDDKKTMDSLKKSWKIFKKKPLSVFIIWLIIAIIGSGVITTVFMLPLLNFLFAQIGAQTTGNFVELMLVLVNNIQEAFIYAVVFLVGVSIARAFQLKAQTDFYKQLK